MRTHRQTSSRPRGPSARTAGILLGLGLGGFIDGIVLHQVLQWHHMVSEVEGLGPTDLGNLRVNVVADGIFHALTWILVFIGVLVLAEIARSDRHVGRISLLGWMAVGWGAFNLVEGVVDHHILGIHQVRPAAANPALYDIGFLVLGVLLVLGGLAVQRIDSGDRTEGEMAGLGGRSPR